MCISDGGIMALTVATHNTLNSTFMLIIKSMIQRNQRAIVCILEAIMNIVLRAEQIVYFLYSPVQGHL